MRTGLALALSSVALLAALPRGWDCAACPRLLRRPRGDLEESASKELARIPRSDSALLA